MLILKSRYRKLRVTYSTVQWYVSREFFNSFGVAFLFFFFIFIINQLLLMAKELAESSVAVIDIFKFLFYAVPVVVMLSIPFAALVGMLMAIAHLASTNQILAMRSCGISVTSLFTPQFVLGCLLTFASLAFNDYFLPLGLIQEQKLRTVILQNNPRIIIKPYAIRGFTTSRGGTTYLISGDVDAQGIHDLTIVDHNEKGERRTFNASLARVADYKQPGVVGLIMEDVSTVIAEQDKASDYEYIYAESLLYNILLSNVTQTLVLSPNQKQAQDIWNDITRLEQRIAPSKLRFYKGIHADAFRISSFYGALSNDAANSDLLSLKELVERYQRTPKNFKNRELQVNKIEFAQRFAVPLVTIPFIILAFSLGLTARRHGRTIGFLLGLAFCFVYWSFLIGAKIAGTNSSLPPYLTMFSGNIFFTIISLYFFLRMRNR